MVNKMKKKVIKPNFYDKFQCIADRCDFTCCQEWAIAVDDETNHTWEVTNAPETVKPQKENLSCYTKKEEGGRVIQLEDDARCPFLDEKGLCKLVLAYGEQVLSETCHTFPREVHYFGTHLEYTLMTCCPAVVDLLDQQDSFQVAWEENEEQQNCFGGAQEENENQQEAKDDKFAASGVNKIYEIRRFFMELVQDERYTLEEALLMIYYYAHDFLDKVDEQSISFQTLQNIPLAEWKALSGELLEVIRQSEKEEEGHFAECNELFLDIIDNYRKRGLYQRHLEGLANKAEELEQSSCSYETSKMSSFLSYEPLMRKILAQDVFADLFMPDESGICNNQDDLEYIAESMVVRLQWIGMEYVLIRHLCYLHAMENTALDYEQMRSYIVLASRIMGYEEQDIYEYLENSFEDLIWEWGYFSYII